MNDTCKNCGGWKGLHHYETNQCPMDGTEAPIGQKQNYKMTVYEADETEDLRVALAAEVAKTKKLRDILLTKISKSFSQDLYAAGYNAAVDQFRERVREMLSVIGGS